MTHNFVTDLIASAGVASVVATIVAAIVKQAKPYAAPEGAKLASLAVGALESRLPAEFRPAVQAELVLLASGADAATSTVTEAAAKVLGKVAPQFPQATLADVVSVVGDFTHAFVAGLAIQPPAPVPAVKPDGGASALPG